ncbi:MAG: MBL fold metallo-hydrolase [Clostridiales bacterium]|nr:MBL fold metallo-hydrolase [Clostridiales bacterium]
MELVPLYSGSSGNATLIRAGGTNILIDAGRNCKCLTQALFDVGTDPCDIDAVFITHSHVDHVSALDVFIRKYPSKLYATEGTFRGMSRRFTKPHELTPDIIIVPGEEFQIAPGVSVTAVSTPHDASGSVCYRIRQGGRTCMVMTDVGYVTEDIKRLATGVDAILIESNYDRRMLVYGGYPEDLKIRIAGDGGHLSNDDCAEMMKYLIDNGTRKFILGHLSENNNTPDKAEQTVCEYLSAHKLTRGVDYTVFIANRYSPTVALEV